MLLSSLVPLNHYIQKTTIKEDKTRQLFKDSLILSFNTELMSNSWSLHVSLQLTLLLSVPLSVCLYDGSC